ncbi:MAG: hypothetical protein ABR568_22370, partial [Pyrinomonadaceae bacterium]
MNADQSEDQNKPNNTLKALIRPFFRSAFIRVDPRLNLTRISSQHHDHLPLAPTVKFAEKDSLPA